MFLNPKPESRPDIAFKALHTIKNLSPKDRQNASFIRVLFSLPIPTYSICSVQCTGFRDKRLDSRSRGKKRREREMARVAWLLLYWRVLFFLFFGDGEKCGLRR